jgi:fructokinase
MISSGPRDAPCRRPKWPSWPRRAEPQARASYGRYVSRLARGLAHVVNLIDPDVIVMGGGMSNVLSLYDDVPPAMRAYVFSDACTTPIVKARHGDSSGVRGAAWLWPKGADKAG